jgi:hypothetical protein
VDDQLPAPVQRLLDAANEHDTARFLAAFTDDGVVDDWGREFRGRDEIARWSDREFIGVNVILDVTGTSAENGAVTISADVGGDGYNGPSHFTFVVSGDRVARMTIRQ